MLDLSWVKDVYLLFWGFFIFIAIIFVVAIKRCLSFVNSFLHNVLLFMKIVRYRLLAKHAVVFERKLFFINWRGCNHSTSLTTFSMFTREGQDMGNSFGHGSLCICSTYSFKLSESVFILEIIQSCQRRKSLATYVPVCRLGTSRFESRATLLFFCFFFIFI